MPPPKPIVILRGDITTLAVDAIVNAANRYLAHGGGVALAIVRKGGATIQAESSAYIAQHGPLNTGDAVITGGGNLPAKFVIHTVGPVWSEKHANECDRQLALAVRNSLTLARERGLKTVALPAISTGIYHFPVERAARILLRAAADHCAGLERVSFCLFDEPTHRVFSAAFAEL
jgi:putative ATPase